MQGSSEPNGGEAVSGGRRALLATAAGLYVEAFWNYAYGASSAASPIPTSTKPSLTTSAASINYASSTTGDLGNLAQQTAHYAIRFSGESGVVSVNVASPLRTWSCACHSLCSVMMAVRRGLAVGH